MKYRKKPVVVDAIQFHRSKTKPKDLKEAFGTDEMLIISSHGFFIDTLEGLMLVSDGDWIIKGVNGEFYPVKPDVFAETYEPEGETNE